MQVSVEQLKDRKTKKKSKVAALDMQIQLLQKKVSASTSRQDRAADTRKKILSGAAMLELAGRSDRNKEWFDDVMKNYLTRLDDKELFGLLTDDEAIQLAAEREQRKKEWAAKREKQKEALTTAKEK